MSGILKEQADIPVGTRFRVFPQYPGEPGFEEPAVIVLKPKPGTIGSGPDDGRLRVIDAVAKTRPYTGLEFPPTAVLSMRRSRLIPAGTSIG